MVLTEKLLKFETISSSFAAVCGREQKKKCSAEKFGAGTLYAFLQPGSRAYLAAKEAMKPLKSLLDVVPLAGYMDNYQ